MENRYILTGRKRIFPSGLLTLAVPILSMYPLAIKTWVDHNTTARESRYLDNKISDYKIERDVRDFENMSKEFSRSLAEVERSTQEFLEAADRVVLEADRSVGELETLKK